jgi:hypothetical protein
MAGANWFDIGSFGLGAIGNIAGGYLQGQGQKAGMEALAKANLEAARQGQRGSMLALSDAQAARAGQYGQNVFGQLAGSLFNMPIDFAFQRRGKEEDLQRFMPMQFAMQRQENRIGEEEEQTPLFRSGQEYDSRMAKLAGKWATTMPMMAQWGRFNTPIE